MSTNFPGRIFGRVLPGRRRVDSGDGFEIYRYYGSDGSFDYERYRKTQIAGNEKKIDKVWVSEENISFLADYIRKTMATRNSEYATAHEEEKSRSGFENTSTAKPLAPRYRPRQRNFHTRSSGIFMRSSRSGWRTSTLSTATHSITATTLKSASTHG
jgi:hypothetical protein